MHNWFQILCIVHCALFIASCNIPNLEPQSCIDSRTAIREFYSFHFGNDMHFSQENLTLRERFLTPDFVHRLRGRGDDTDPFTTGNLDVPKAFRVGECREIANNRVEFKVLLFWRDDVRSEQRGIKVDVKKLGGGWLVDEVYR
jgi:hypothetical protein